MRTKQKLFLSVAALFVLLAAPASTRANDSSNLRGMESDFPIAEVHFSSDALSWNMMTAYEAATLTVSGPEGLVVQAAFEDGDIPRFDMDTVELLPDGQYHWEINLAIKEFSGEEEYQQPFRMMGQFLVASGLIRPLLGERGVKASVALPSDPEVSYIYDVTGDWNITGWLGVGTDDPVNPIHIVQPVPTIQFTDSDYVTPDPIYWYVNGEDVGFDISSGDNNYSERIFYIASGAPQPSFWIDGAGNTGVGTSTPAAPLHVRRSDGTAQILLEDTGTEETLTALHMKNNGRVQAFYENTSTGDIWQLSQHNTGFVISRVGTGGAEFRVLNDGGVLMGPGATTTFNLDPLGNLIISGNLTELSDQNEKENIVPVNPSEILEQLIQLPIAEWSRKGDAEGVRHVGPMAQDFRAAFGLGQDERHLATLDTSGVALAAIKGLNEKLQEKDVLLDDQQERIENLEAELAQIKAILNTR